VEFRFRHAENNSDDCNANAHNDKHVALRVRRLRIGLFNQRYLAKCDLMSAVLGEPRQENVFRKEMTPYDSSS